MLIHMIHIPESIINCLNIFCALIGIFKCFRRVFPGLAWKYTALFCQSCTFHTFNLASNPTMESRELRSWLGPCSLVFNSDGYLIMSTINTKLQSHLRSLRSLTGCLFISMNFLTTSRSSLTS